MFQFYNGRKARPEKEKVLLDIIDLFAHTVKITDGTIRVYESCDTEGLVFVRIDVGFILECGAGLQRLSEIVEKLYYMNIEPNGDKLTCHFAVDDVFENNF